MMQDESPSCIFLCAKMHKELQKNLTNATTWPKIFKIHEKNMKKTQFVQQNT